MTTNSSSVPASVRIDVKLPVRLLGQDVFGIPFDDSSVAEVLHSNGATVRCDEQLSIDQKISIGYTGRLVPAKVTQLLCQDLYEIVFTSPQPNFWGIEFQAYDGTGLTLALLQCSKCSKMVPFELSDFECILVSTSVEVDRFCPACNAKTMWKRAELGIRQPVFAPETPSNRRKQNRVRVGFDAGVKWFGKIREGKVLDASRNGLRLAINARFRVGDSVHVSAPFCKDTANIFLPFRVTWVKDSPTGDHEYGLEMNPEQR